MENMTLPMENGTYAGQPAVSNHKSATPTKTFVNTSKIYSVIEHTVKQHKKTQLSHLHFDVVVQASQILATQTFRTTEIWANSPSLTHLQTRTVLTLSSMPDTETRPSR